MFMTLVFVTCLLTTPTFIKCQFHDLSATAIAMLNTAMKTGYRTNGNFLQNPFPTEMKFPCNVTNTTSPTLPTSVHQLRPGDIDVIASIGDSFTSAAGAASTSAVEISIQNRGFSFSGGGQWQWRNVTTLPNIFKKFNPYLIGYAKGDGVSYRKLAEFNLAELGYLSFHMPSMAKTLVHRIRNDVRVDFNKHWKMVTLMIGLNDVCDQLCVRTNPKLYPDEFINNIKNALNYLRDNLPRTFVNLVPAPPLRNVLMHKDDPDHCKMIQFILCPCLLNNNSKDFMKLVRSTEERIWQLEYELAQSYRGLDNFTVVYQPFFENFTIENSTGGLDYTLTAYDCFHLSQKGNAWAGIALWNNLLEPIGNKSKRFTNSRMEFLCPAENQFLPTYDNDPSVQIPE